MSKRDEPKEEYPSSEFFLGFIKDEYDKQNQRRQTIDTKAGILLALASVVFPQMLSQFSDGSLFGWTAFVAIGCGLVALVLLIISVWTYNYEGFLPSDMAKDSLQMMKLSDATRAMSRAIAKKAENNSKKNSLKARFYLAGAVCLVISITFFSVSILFNTKSISGKEENLMPKQQTVSTPSASNSASQNTQPATVDEATALLSTPHYETSELHTPKEARSTPSVSPSTEKTNAPQNK